MYGILHDDYKTVRVKCRLMERERFDCIAMLLRRTPKEPLLAQEKISWSAIILIVLLAWVSVLRRREQFKYLLYANSFRIIAGDGALLPSPTREKLEPAIPRRREDTKEHREEIQPKTKSSPKNSPRTGRSQSLGPTMTERRSPKRQPSRAPSVTKDAKVFAFYRVTKFILAVNNYGLISFGQEKEREPKDKEKEHKEKSGEPERHPRPSK